MRRISHHTTTHNALPLLYSNVLCIAISPYLSTFPTNYKLRSLPVHTILSVQCSLNSNGIVPQSNANQFQQTIYDGRSFESFGVCCPRLRSILIGEGEKWIAMNWIQVQFIRTFVCPNDSEPNIWKHLTITSRPRPHINGRNSIFFIQHHHKYAKRIASPWVGHRYIATTNKMIETFWSNFSMQSKEIAILRPQ